MTKSTYQIRTGSRCTCRPGQERDNCAACEGTGWRLDFKAMRAQPFEPLAPDSPEVLSLLVETSACLAHCALRLPADSTLRAEAGAIVTSIRELTGRLRSAASGDVTLAQPPEVGTVSWLAEALRWVESLLKDGKSAAALSAVTDTLTEYQRRGGR